MHVKVRLWSVTTGEAIGHPLRGHTNRVTALAFEPLFLVSSTATSPRLASASADTTIRVWNTSSRKVHFVLTGHSGVVNQVRWGGENLIYTASYDQTVKVWSGVDVSFPLQRTCSGSRRSG